MMGKQKKKYPSYIVADNLTELCVLVGIWKAELVSN